MEEGEVTKWLASCFLTFFFFPPSPCCLCSVLWSATSDATLNGSVPANNFPVPQLISDSYQRVGLCGRSCVTVRSLSENIRLIWISLFVWFHARVALDAFHSKMFLFNGKLVFFPPSLQCCKQEQADRSLKQFLFYCFFIDMNAAQWNAVQALYVSVVLK